jgi:glycosyltransferase involved in cell wall biosynthesis
MPTMLWWGRFDPEYSRNRVLRKLLPGLGWQVVDFHPILSATADMEAWLRRLPKPDLVWVPCFRQRDLAAARRWSRKRGIPMLFDPLISAYDKQVFEREKFGTKSTAARRLLAWERKLFQSVDRIIADTTVHADYFAETLGVPRECLSVVYVGAEETLFKPGQLKPEPGSESLEVLFYGSFIPLHGADVIAEAARLYEGPHVHWRFVGKGPSRARCEALTRGMDNVTFEDWVAYPNLPSKIRQADIVLGVFGTTPKAGRVIPNKVFQALACGRPVITRRSPAYPKELSDDPASGIIWVDAGSPAELSEKLSELMLYPQALEDLSHRASATYQRYFSSEVIAGQLAKALSGY